MGIRVEEEVREGVGFETKQVRQKYTLRRYFGPCLICEKETEYSPESHLSDEWLAKQFKRRRMLLSILRGSAPSYTSPSVAYIHTIVCSGCREEYGKLRATASEDRAAKWRQEQKEAKEWKRKVEESWRAHTHHYEWRDVTAEQIDPTPHAAEFRALFASFEVHQILFRWRATAGKCRGDSYLMKVGMWVDAKLTAHYHGWDLHDIDVLQDDDHHLNGFEEKWPTADLFGGGFCRWIERAFQSRLLGVEPDLVWSPGCYTELDTQIRRPATLRVDWPDGTRYVHVLPSLNLHEVAEWAEQYLELRIEERAFRPVRRAETVDEAEDQEQ
jgi:hypothetical protein